jgi:hypothetical protein
LSSSPQAGEQASNVAKTSTRSLMARQ